MVNPHHTMHGFFVPGFPKLSRFETHFKKILKKYKPKIYKHLVWSFHSYPRNKVIAGQGDDSVHLSDEMVVWMFPRSVCRLIVEELMSEILPPSEFRSL